MIYHVNTTMILPGKEAEAQQIAQKFATHVNATYPRLHIQILRNVNGKSKQIHWLGRFESLAAYEEISQKFSTDARFRELWLEGSTILDFHGSVDNFFRVIAE